MMVEGTCSSANSGSTIVSTTLGTVSESIIHTSSSVGERCEWTLQCPLGSSILVKTVGATADLNAYLTISTLFPNGTIQEVQRWANSMPKIGAILDSNRARVTLIDDSTVPSQTSLNVSYECLATGCSSPNATLSGSLITASAGRLLSDADGVYSKQFYQKNERCSYQIACPASNASLLITMRGLTYGLIDPLSLYTANANGTLREAKRFYGSTTTNLRQLYLDANAMTVNFSSSPRTPGVAGWSLEWSCSPSGAAKCVSPNASQTQTVADQGTLYSNDPSQSSAVKTTFPGQDCRWSLSCASAGYQYMLFSARSFQSSPVALYFLYPNSTSLMKYLPLDGTFTKGFSLEETSLSVAFQPSAAVSTASRWELRYRCSEFRCSALIVPQNFSTTEGTMKSDGFYSQSYGEREDCRWFIHCPVGAQYLAMGARVKLGSADKLTVSTLDGEPIITHRTSSYFYYQALGNETSVEVRFVSSSSVPTSAAGFTLDYRCLPSRCSSVNATGSTFTATKGRIISDTDGYGRNTIMYPQELCEWTVSCPVGKYFAITSLEYEVGASIFIMPSVGLEPLSEYNSETDGDVLSEVFKESKVRIVFNATSGSSNQATVATNSPNLDSRGFTLDYECLPTPCLSSPKTYQEETSGRLSSDPDGSRTTMRQTGGQDCQWSIGCDSLGKDSLYFVQHGDLDWGEGDYFRDSEYSSTHLETSVQSNWTSGNVYFKSTPYTQVTSSDYPTRGADLYYTCQPHVCYSPNRSTTKFIGSGTEWKEIWGFNDIEALSSSGIEYCSYTIACPVGYEFLLLDYSTQSNTGQYFTFKVFQNESNRYPESIRGNDGSRIVPAVSNPVSVDYTSRNGPSYRDGWSIEFQCRRSQCTSPNSAQSWQEDPTAVVQLTESWTYLQGGVRSPITLNSECSWTVRCPSAQDHIEVNISYSTSSGTSTAGRPNITFFASSLLSTTHMAESDRTILFNVGHARNDHAESWEEAVVLPTHIVDIEQTKTLYRKLYRYMLALRCKPASETCPPLVTSNGARAGTLQSDADGYLREHKYAALTQCEWSIVCPAPSTQSLRLYYRGYMGTEQDKPWLTLSDPVSPTQELHPFFHSHRQYLFRQGTANVHWKASEGPFSTAYKRGFSIEYDCIDKLPLPSVPVSTNASLCSHSGGPITTTGTVSVTTKFFAGPGGSRCVWQFQCANPSTQSVVLQGEAPSAGYRFSFSDETGAPLLYTDDSQFPWLRWICFTFSAVRTVNVAVDFTSGEATLNAAVHFTLTCLPWPASTQTSLIWTTAATPQPFSLYVRPNEDQTLVYETNTGNLLKVVLWALALPLPLYNEDDYILIADGGPNNASSLRIVANYTYPPAVAVENWTMTTSALIVRIVTKRWTAEQAASQPAYARFGTVETTSAMDSSIFSGITRGSKTGTIVTSVAGVVTGVTGILFLVVLVRRWWGGPQAFSFIF